MTDCVLIGNAGLMQFSDLLPSENTFASTPAQPLRNGNHQQNAIAMDLEPFDMQEPAVYLPQKPTNQIQNGGSQQFPASMIQMPYIGTVPQNGDQMHSEVIGRY